MIIERSGDDIFFRDPALSKCGRTNYSDALWDIVHSVNWYAKKGNDGEPRYLYSSQLKKTLHQVVMDYYFGEDTRKEAYRKGMIIEHLNNDGFDCRISNLYYLLDVKNKYKGQHFDQLSKQSIPIVSMKVFHIIENHTFQITMLFNDFFANAAGEYLHSAKLLYNTDYWIVIQDAEVILENIVQTRAFSLPRLTEICRFKDVHIQKEPQVNIVLTEEEKKYPNGGIVVRDGQYYVIRKNDGSGIFYGIETPYDKDWN